MATGRGLVAELARGHYRTAAGAAAFRQDVKIDPRHARHSMRTPRMQRASVVLLGRDIEQVLHEQRHRPAARFLAGPGGAGDVQMRPLHLAGETMKEHRAEDRKSTRLNSSH